ncbi:MAG: hypothetical protein KF805_15760 [Phycisphaeraceae bacterium]|nr:hypothetical protein [Phycisphaeraceae bacterium]
MAAFIMAFAAPARAFEVKYHESITKEALRGIRVTISGHEYGFSEKALLEICEHNIATDDRFPPRAALFHPEWHFTNEQFEASSLWLIQAKNSALADLRGYPAPMASQARQRIGRALHTVQDFYSHSNWVDAGGGGNLFDALGREIVPNPPESLRPCPDNRDQLGGDGKRFLTSAYFVGTCGCGGVGPGKCYHGNYGNLACIGTCLDDGQNGINKDIEGRDSFWIAYFSAVAATEDYIRQIIEPLEKANDERALAALLGVVGVGFAIDISTSMNDALPGVKRTAVSMAENGELQIAGKANVFVLAAFDGASVEIATTDNVSEFAARVALLVARDKNATCEENSFAARLAAIANLPPDSELFLWTDAPPSDSSLSARVDAAARAKHIRITRFEENNCGLAGAARDSGGSEPAALSSSSEGELDSSELSVPAGVSGFDAATGGIVLGLSRSADADYSSLVLPAAIGRTQVVLSKALSKPSARSGHAMAYDATRGVMVLFGGSLSANGDSRETWEWNGASWTLRATTGPLALNGHAMAYDSTRGVTVLFGGRTTTGAYNGETWEWNGTSWTLRAATGPTARSRHAMVWDAARGVIVLFGGEMSGNIVASDTWEWDGTSWTQRASTGPSSRIRPAMAYDSVRGVTVLFGGYSSGAYNDETWEWNGSSWSQREVAGPSAREGHAMAFDTARGVAVLFGGTIVGSSPNGETWEWNGESWTRSATTGPSPRSSLAAAYDEARDATMLFGGFAFGNDNDEAWEWNGTSWDAQPTARIQDIPIDATSSLQLRVAFGAPNLFDPSGAMVTAETPGVIVETFGASTIYTVFSPTPGSWSLLGNEPTSVQIVVDSEISFADAGFVTDNSAAPEGVHGGFAPIADMPLDGESQVLRATLLGDVASVEFSIVDESGGLIAPLNLVRNYPRAVADDFLGVVVPPSQPFRVVATGVSASGSVFRREFGTLFRAVPFRVVAVGQSPAPAPCGGQSTYEFSIENKGPSRTFTIAAIGALGNLVNATPASVTVPANTTKTVIVSDPTPWYNLLSTNGGEVRLVVSTTSNPSLSNSATLEAGIGSTSLGCLRGIPVGASIAFGGSTGTYSGETWGWDGTGWTKRATTGPLARYLHAVAFDSARGVTVLFGGDTETAPYNGETWEWNGKSWTQRATTGPAARYGHAMAFDAARRVATLFGGYTSSGYNGQTWTWNGAFWTLRSGTGPTARYGHAMAYDTKRGVITLFGGYTGANSSETWEWNGTSWTKLAATGPSARRYHAMAYDSTRGVTVLFGGIAGTYDRQTWEWNGTSWTLRATTGPAALYGHTMAYDSARGVTVLFGGFTGSSYSSQTWEWNGSSWSQRVTTGPSARYGHAMAYDPFHTAPIVSVRLPNVRVGNTVDLDDNAALANLTLEDDTGAITVSGNNTLIQSILDAATDGNVLSFISGTVDESNGLRQLVDVTAVVPANYSEPVQVRSVIPADFADSSSTAEELESHVVAIDNYTFAQTGAFAVGNYSNGGVTVRVSTAALAAVFNSQFGTIPTGVPLRIAGVFSQNDPTYPFDGGYQLLATSMMIPCPADMNADGLVDDSDFIIFVVAYNILDCADPTMTAECPADLNGDGFVDDADFSIFVVAYNELLCP